MTVTLAGKKLPAEFTQKAARVSIKLSGPAEIETNQALTVEIGMP